MFVEDSGSSIDGEIGYADSSASFDRSPVQARAAALPDRYFDDVNDTALTEDSLRPPESRSVQHEFKFGADESSLSNTCSIFLPALLKINEMLTERGPTPLAISSSDIDLERRSVSVFVLDAWAESVVASLEEVFERQDKHKSAIQESSFSNHSAEASREAMEKHIRDLQRKLQVTEKKLSARSLQTDNLEDSFEKSEQKIKSSEKDTQKKINSLENVIKESDRKLKMAYIEIDKMKKKLQQFVAKDQETRERYSDVLSGSAVASLVKGVSPSPASKSKIRKVGKSSPLSPEDVVKAIDADRIELEQFNAELRAQVHSLTETIRDLENRNRFGQHHNRLQSSESQSDDNGDDDEFDTSRVDKNEPADRHREYQNVPGSMKVLFGKIKDQQHRIEHLVHREGVLEAENRRCEEALDVYRQRSSEMMEEIENLRIELDGRPSVRAFAQKQKEVTELESKLHDVIMMRKEAAEVASFKKYLSTGDRIKADKRNHQLGLWIIESIPTAVVKEVLQAACRELDISDISQLQPSIAKLKAVVQTVPRLEAFTTRLCGFVFDRQRPTHPEGDLKEEPVLEDILPIIKKWWSQLARGSELYKFQEAILKELDRRERILGAACVEEVDEESFHQRPIVIPELFSDRSIDEVTNAYEWETRRRAMWMKRDPNIVIDLISDLINFQLESFQNTQSYQTASDFIAQNPEKMVNRLLAHLQYVFDVKDLQGLVPRMNQVYLSLEESKNFISSLRQSLNMKDAQNAVVITETIRRISAQNQAEILNNNGQVDPQSSKHSFRR